MRRFSLALLLAIFSAGSLATTNTSSEDDPFAAFDDAPLTEAVGFPAWFKLSFLDLADDIEEAGTAGKRGLIVYFGQKYCAYCKKLLEGNFGLLDILAYTEEHFDVIGIDIHGQRSMTGLDGKEWTERSFAAEQSIDFTPTLVFYDNEQREALRLPGYYPPYQLRAALEYVADGHYRKEDFRTYLERADVSLVFEAGGMNYEPFFSPPPHALDRSRWPAEKPLVVFFEQGDCHACDVLHTGPLTEPDVRASIERMDVAQLGMWEDTPVITPAGERTTARAWADRLGLFYSPTLIFFDEAGDEILRLDSVVQFYRLRKVLDYVQSGAYRDYPNFQQWRSATGN
ncbi:MAG: thioredoxin fold domain-containing protein [Thiogranum sp.]|nr:thioredoxin fold domain-containing protein [Thiogranum sp.]